MKKTVKIVSIVLLMSIFFVMSGCGKSDKGQGSEETHASSAELVGTWKGTGNESSTLTLGEDGSYKDVAGDVSVIGTYTVDDVSGTLTVNERDYGLVLTYDYDLLEDNLTLQMEGGLPRTFARQ